ncbi:galactose oxidase [Pedobacter sp. B4-66]|uniref:galactose oxidase n=1 Tax=Pedobacter sp. B4-66 TaxID=2817280 RepID=UPI001BDAA773|nr:galactose oxidase [Pedobacter sp. B4-66]
MIFLQLKTSLIGTAFLLLLLIISVPAYSQSYGLGFAGHEVVQDKRTALDLSPEQPLCFDRSFELSFDLSFMPGYADYFGYVFRLIDQDKRNIDLIYDMRFLENKHFKLIVGDKITDIAFDIDTNRLYKNWHNLKLKFNTEHQELVMTADGKSYKQKVSLKSNCYKVFFGANSYKDFSVKDVPPMNIKDVKITENDKLSFHWTLDGNGGTRVVEKIKGKDGTVVNPIWIKKMHHDWELVKTLNIKGLASVALNPKKESLYVVTEDSLITYNVISNKLSFLSYSSGKQHLYAGNQSIYDANTDKLFNFYIDQKLVANFNFTNKTWDKNYTTPDVITNYWHPNKFYSAIDSSLYMIGGYGQYTYRRSIERYHFPDKKWTTIKAAGEFTPRYLSALGTVKDGAYILGGYGSATGQQILNPKNIYDLNFYNVKHKTFKKLFELAPPAEEFVFANSMVINEKEGTYFALTFPNNSFNSSLQLIEGSLHLPTYKLVGNSIPYPFHDIYSFADLFYCPENKKFVAVVLFHEEKTNMTSVKVYTLSGPPEAALADAQKGLFWLKSKYLLILVPLLALIGFVLFRRKSRKRKESVKVQAPVQGQPVDEAVSEQYENVEQYISEERELVKNAIFLFGDLQLFDKEGEDITKYFSPLLRELFLVVLVYTIKWGRGISSEKLTEILWFDKTADSARNNRSVNIVKLKVILEKMAGCQISKQTGYWKIDFDDTKVKIDYSQYLNIVSSKGEMDKRRVNELTKIIHRGSFLSNVEYDWLDTFKSDLSNEIIDAYLHYAATIKITDDPEFMINLANYVFYFDPVNEEAMIIKCKALVHLGKHSLAKTKFETFNKEYKAIYGEEFKHSFQEILE